MRRFLLILSALAWIGLFTTDSAAATQNRAAAADSTRSKNKGAAAKSAPKSPVRTLDAIRIEGEIDVPQVLFITARDYRRFRDGTGDRYRTTPAGVAKNIPRPGRLRMVEVSN